MNTQAQPQQGQPPTPNPNRMRNTSTNGMSKQNIYGQMPGGISGGDLPALDPAAVANYYGQIQTLQAQLTNALAGLKQQRIGLRGEASSMRSDVRSQGRQAVVEGIQGAMDRGMLGSSADVEQRIGGIANMKSGVADVNRQLYDQLAQNRLGEQAAALQYQQGVQGVEMGAIASRMNLAAQDLQNDLAIKIANMQAAASAKSTAASLRVARYQAQTERQRMQNNTAMANSPYGGVSPEMWAAAGMPSPYPSGYKAQKTYVSPGR